MLVVNQNKQKNSIVSYSTVFLSHCSHCLYTVINNAGYFYGPCEKITEDNLNFDEELKQIDVCAVGPLRVSSALVNAKALAKDAKIVVITSQAGSVEWRKTQNKDEGGDYGHHMSRAACNIMAVLMSEELKKLGYTVILLHPGFNRTEMTAKYKEIWDKEGAFCAWSFDTFCSQSVPVCACCMRRTRASL
jgi:NAD(P)-dependent dehydrogenase (short-subunit alcohol dehydrogenase family)